MKRFALVGILLLLISGTALAAGDQQARQVLQVNSLTKTSTGMSIELALDPVALVAGEAEPMGFATVGEDGTGPATVSRMVRLPATGGVEVQVLESQYDEMTRAEYAAQYGVEFADRLFEGLDNAANGWYPEQLAAVSEPAILRDFRVATLSTSPVRVNPVSQRVRVYTQLAVDLTYTEHGPNELHRTPTKLSRAFIPIYQDFLDWTIDEIDQYETYEGQMVVVMRESAEDDPYIQSWLQWKEQKGWDITLLTGPNNWTSNQVEDELEALWAAADPKFEWIVVIGDNTGTYAVPPAPAPPGAWSQEGDHNYATLEGNDQLPEVGIGRISVEDQNDLSVYINKVFTYEKDVYTANTDWYLRGMTAAGSASSGVSTIYLGRYARHAALDIGYTQVDTAWFNQGVNVNQISRTAIEDGVTFFNYRGYVGSGFSTGEIGNLQNANKLPVVFHITCGTGDWVNGYGKNEAWMRAGSFNQARGAIGAISVATISTHTRYNNSLSGGAIEALLVHQIPELGGTIFGSKVNLYKAYSETAPGSVADFADWANLMGDPTVWVYTDIPASLDVTAPTELELGQREFPVSVMVDGQPAEGAWVTLWKSDDNEKVISKGVLDASGSILLDAEFGYTGEAILTVTRQNAETYQVTVPVVSGQRIGFTDVEVFDNNQFGTSGDADGMPEAGETVGLRLTLQNYGSSPRNNVTATLTAASDPMIVSVSGTQDFGTIGAGQEAVGSGELLLVEIDPSAPDGWMPALPLEINSGALSLTDVMQLELGAPKYAVAGYNPAAEMIPGSTTTLTVTLQNIGRDESASGTARLISLDPYFIVNQETATIGSILPGQQNTTSSFDVGAHTASFRGYPARAMVEVTTNEGHVDTTWFTIVMGNRRPEDPVGPDRYGYIAFDNRDTDYDLAPEFDWVEISTEEPSPDYPGTRQAINDNGEDDDDSAVLNLPFPITYYGEEFDQITLSGNGFVAMGNQGDMMTPRNWPIPSPLGPNYMIAPYWDDRVVRPSDDSGVYTFYDESNDRFIVEWYRVGKQSGGAPYNTFQVIFFDQVPGHFTVSGDNEFMFQYLNVDHSEGYGFDNFYYTAGIENGDQTDGIELVYWDATSVEVDEGRAILFTTQVELITGGISGTVTYQADNSPVEGATVRTADSLFVTTTGPSGNYIFNEIVVGTHDLVVEGIGLNTVMEEDVEVVEGEVTVVDFQVTQPGFQLDTSEIIQQVEPGDSAVVPVTVTNVGDGPVSFQLSISPLPPDQADDPLQPYDELITAPTGGTDNRNRGITFHHDYIWVAGGNNNQNPNKLHVYDKDGQFLASIDQPHGDQSGAGFRALTTDGDFIYGLDNNQIYQMEFDPDANTIEVVDSFPAPLDFIRYMAYVPGQDVFLIGERYTPITVINRSGQVLTEIETGELEPLAIAWHPSDPDNMNLYFWTQSTPYEPFVVHKMDPQGGGIAVQDSLAADMFQVMDIQLTYLWNPAVWAMVSLQNHSAGDRLQVHYVDTREEWISPSVSQGVIQPGEALQIDLTVHAGSLPDGMYDSWLRFDHNAIGGLDWLPMTVDVGEISGIAGQGTVPLPDKYEFNGVYPNPFNPTAVAAFSLKEAQRVNVRLYNVLGQQVMEVMNDRMPAGRHEVMIHGRDLTSGVYFLHVDAGPLQHTAKVVLLR